VPVFPSKTFPNHYTIATGLHPDRHGIIDNTMVDPALGRFSLSARDAVGDGRWWGGEPIWVTVERQGLRAATCFWPGSEAEIGGVRPTYWMAYDAGLAGEERVRIVLEWLDLPSDRRPSLLTLYWSDVDSAAHDRGPESPETAAAIDRVDRWMGMLLAGLEQRGLYDGINLLVVSDHGMAPTPPEQMVYLADYVDLEGIEISGGTPALLLRPPESRVEKVRRALDGAHPALSVWRRERTPRRFRFRDHPRIPPLVVAVDEGWNLRATRDSSSSGSTRPAPLGMHGYDPRLPSMHGVLVGHGPGLASGARVGRVENIHLYELMCHLLGVEPAANEGRLRAVESLLRRRP
jgi:predicted AlkP superfamily pyrophosphatase or phosphodiesterase